MKKALTTINLIFFMLGVCAVDSNIYFGVLAIISIIIVAIIEGAE